MSVYGLMRTGASGMAAQGNRLGAVADNVANVNTTGYKRASTEFSTLVLGENLSDYQSGGVETDVRYAISRQGNLQSTASVTDLAISGAGFFLVEDKDAVVLTRAGSFVPDGDGLLVNAAGMKLLGYPVQAGGNTVVANGTAGLEQVTVTGLSLVASPSTAGSLTVNLPASASLIAPADLPSANAATSEYSAKSSLVAFDNVGNEVLVDVYFARVSATDWEVTIYETAAAAPGVGFPYATPALSTETIVFDVANGSLVGPAVSTFTLPGGSAIDLDFAGTTQLAADYAVLDVDVNGNAPSSVENVEFAQDGFVYVVFESGARQAAYRVPVATVASPDRLEPVAGNVFRVTSDSGDLRIGFPGDGGLGSIVSGALESSNVDLASELTTMIESQRNYTANSKVFQTGSDLLDVLVNLKR